MTEENKDKPMLLGPIEEFKEISVQRMSEYGDYNNNSTAYTPTKCVKCLSYYPALYMFGEVCRFCEQTP